MLRCFVPLPPLRVGSITAWKKNSLRAIYSYLRQQYNRSGENRSATHEAGLQALAASFL